MRFTPQKTLRQIPIGRRIVAAWLIGLTLVCVVVAVAVRSGTQAINAAARRQVTEQFATVQQTIEHQVRTCAALADSLAWHPAVQDAMQQNDRDLLIAMLESVYARLVAEHGITVMQFHQPAARVLVRIHDVTRYGDDLSGRRPAVAHVNQVHQPLSGIEVGRDGPMIVALAPVSAGPEHVGCVEIAMPLDELALLGSSADSPGVGRVLIHTARHRSWGNHAASIGGGAVLGAGDMQTALQQDQPIIQPGQVNGQPVMACGAAWRNISGEPAGVMELVVDATDPVTSSHQLVFDATISTAILLTVGAALFLVILAGVLRPLRRLTGRLAELSHGHIQHATEQDQQAGDELGAANRSLDQFTDRMAQVLESIVVAARAAQAQADHLTHAGEQLDNGLAQQVDQAQQVAAAIEQMSAAVTEVAQRSAEAAEAAEQAGQEANGGGQIVSRTVEGITAISESVDRSSQSINELSERSEQIGHVIAVINEIAEQTNLLALNAAIEAARAGEHGRGFAVVADEVRKLADRTTEATAQISQSVEDIQQRTAGAGEQMAEGHEQVAGGLDLARQAGQALETIVAGSRQVTGMIQSIASATEQQSATAGQIAMALEAIREGCTTASASNQQAQAAGSELAQHIEKITQLADGLVRRG